jgi:amino acid adenylation domain-containing protein
VQRVGDEATATSVADGAFEPIDFGGPTDRPFDPFPAEALEGSVLDRFALMAGRYPDRLALQDHAASLTYAELEALARRGARAVLAAVGDRPGPVAILAGHDVSFPVALLAVMAAGRGAVPIGADHPPDRSRRIAAHAGASAVLASGGLAAMARRLFPAGLPVIDLDHAEPSVETGPLPRPCPDDLAYVLYTSGSTGEPKGVWHDHRNCLHDAMLFTNNAHVTADDRFSVFYSGVIAATRRTFAALLNGASLHLLSPLELGAEGMAREIRTRNITVLYDVPTIFRRIVGALSQGERLDSVRLVRLSGDRSDWSDYDAFRRACPDDACFGINLGSTEASSTYAHWYVDEAVRAPGARLPVGRPMHDLRLIVADEAGEPLPDGEIGEFVVASRYLARGYWAEPEATAMAFRPDPEDPQGRLFRTGDLGLRRPDGLLEFVGRKDQQIKLRGHRIEPAEAEAGLRTCSGVADAAVIIRRTSSGAPRAMVAFVEPRPGVRGLLPRHVMAMARRALPKPLVPAIVIVVEALPRLASFKPDRAALARRDEALQAEAANRSDDAILRTVAASIESVLGVEGATPEDNLLSLGGDSLQAPQVMLELERRLGIAIPPSVFENSQTIAEVAFWAAGRLPADWPPEPR